MENMSRPEPPMVAAEKDTLVGFLEFQRATVLWKCEGLTPEQLGRRAVEPSPMSLHGLVRHLTEDEIGWFSRVAGEDPVYPYSTDDAPDGAWTGTDPAAYDEDLRRYHAAVDRSREITAAYGPDHTGLHRGRPVTLRWVLGHMLEEYARHAGHADLLRERIDGATGE